MSATNRCLEVGSLADFQTQDYTLGIEYPDRSVGYTPIRAVGIGVQAGIIVGLDGDDVTVFDWTLRFLQRHPQR